MITDDGPDYKGTGRKPLSGRSMWLVWLAFAVLFGILAVLNWALGSSLFQSILQTVLAVAYGCMAYVQRKRAGRSGTGNG